MVWNFVKFGRTSFNNFYDSSIINFAKLRVSVLYDSFLQLNFQIISFLFNWSTDIFTVNLFVFNKQVNQVDFFKSSLLCFLFRTSNLLLAVVNDVFLFRIFQLECFSKWILLVCFCHGLETDFFFHSVNTTWQSSHSRTSFIIDMWFGYWRWHLVCSSVRCLSDRNFSSYEPYEYTKGSTPSKRSYLPSQFTPNGNAQY